MRSAIVMLSPDLTSFRKTDSLFVALGSKGEIKNWFRLLPGGIASMACKRCSSENLSNFTAEMNFHFPGWEGLEKNTVWIFPEVIVCLDCGLAEFTFPASELPSLREGAA